MKTVIVPTDFSHHANNALQYACEMYKNTGAQIVLMHSYSVPVPVGDSYMLQPLPDITELKQISENELNRVRSDYEVQYEGLQFINEAIMGAGAVTSDIVDCAVKRNAELIIMGTHGASGLQEFLVGTNTASVMDDSKCPVLSIPENAAFLGMKKIMFAADYGSHNFDHIAQLMDIARRFNSEIILLHVAANEEYDAMAEHQIIQFKERIISESGYTNISYRLLEDKDIYHGLHTYVEEFMPDMIAISMRNRSLLEKIFSRSLTKRMAYHSHVPVLALHIKEPG